MRYLPDDIGRWATTERRITCGLWPSPRRHAPRSRWIVPLSRSTAVEKTGYRHSPPIRSPFLSTVAITAPWVCAMATDAHTTEYGYRRPYYGYGYGRRWRY